MSVPEPKNAQAGANGENPDDCIADQEHRQERGFCDSGNNSRGCVAAISTFGALKGGAAGIALAGLVCSIL
jgi:hypothetical protein